MTTPYLTHIRRARRNSWLRGALTVATFFLLLLLTGFYWAWLGTALVASDAMSAGQIVFCFLAGLALASLTTFAWYWVLRVYARRWRMKL